MAMWGQWDWEALGRDDFETLDAVYRLRREDVEAAMHEWLTRTVWEDRPPPPIDYLLKLLHAAHVDATAEDLLGLPVTVEIDAGLASLLWTGTHRSLARLVPMRPNDPRLNPGTARFSVPILNVSEHSPETDGPDGPSPGGL
jgi:hypothetical protein